MPRRGGVGRIVSKEAQIAKAAAAIVEKEAERKRLSVEKTEKEAEEKRVVVEMAEKRVMKTDGKRMNGSDRVRDCVFLRASIFVRTHETPKWKQRRSNWKKSTVSDDLLTPHRHKFADWHLRIDRTPRGTDLEARRCFDEIDSWVHRMADDMNEGRHQSTSWNHKQATWSRKFAINEGDLLSRIKLHWVIGSNDSDDDSN
ncbi:MAG: hypothetical protein Hyperionvirus10_38 [Hyperionvirus sp.]|uniref:Uncharacterized protein n=1 Tax=Hyperionvirus sp. TaxID=2487770 RepID=A0A3G5A9E1_9VIRU|nr:MAG: hypothetical protein Hyperionvirus10_38 [Hyperionvirus sp.]